MPAGNYGEVLVEVADRLCAELVYVEAREAPGAHSTLGDKGVMVGILSPKDESLVRGIREGLAKIAAAVATGADDSNLSAVQTALDGSEMVVRGELMSGREDHLPRLMPSFVFLAVLPTVGQDRALALSKRASELIRHGLEERG